MCFAVCTQTNCLFMRIRLCICLQQGPDDQCEVPLPRLLTLSSIDTFNLLWIKDSSDWLALLQVLIIFMKELHKNNNEHLYPGFLGLITGFTTGLYMYMYTDWPLCAHTFFDLIEQTSCSCTNIIISKINVRLQDKKSFALFKLFFFSRLFTTSLSTKTTLLMLLTGDQWLLAYYNIHVQFTF